MDSDLAPSSPIPASFSGFRPARFGAIIDESCPRASSISPCRAAAERRRRKGFARRTARGPAVRRYPRPLSPGRTIAKAINGDYDLLEAKCYRCDAFRWSAARAQASAGDVDLEIRSRALLRALQRGPALQPTAARAYSRADLCRPGRNRHSYGGSRINRQRGHQAYPATLLAWSSKQTNDLAPGNSPKNPGPRSELRPAAQSGGTLDA